MSLRDHRAGFEVTLPLLLSTLMVAVAGERALSPEEARVRAELGLPLNGEFSAFALHDLPGRCLLEARTIEHIYTNGAALSTSVDGVTWAPAGAVDGSLAVLVVGEGGRMGMLRHRQIAGMYPILVLSRDGGGTWASSEAFSAFFWAQSVGSVSQARALHLGSGERIALELDGEWVETLDGETWATRAGPPGWLSAPETPTGGRCQAIFDARYSAAPLTEDPIRPIPLIIQPAR